MVRVGEQHLRAAPEEVFAALRTDGRMSAHRHEGGGQNLVMPGRKARGARPRIRSGSFEFEFQPPQACYLTASFAAEMTRLTWSNSGRADCEPLSVDLSSAAK